MCYFLHLPTCMVQFRDVSLPPPGGLGCSVVKCANVELETGFFSQGKFPYHEEIFLVFDGKNFTAIRKGPLPEGIFSSARRKTFIDAVFFVARCDESKFFRVDILQSTMPQVRSQHFLQLTEPRRRDSDTNQSMKEFPSHRILDSRLFVLSSPVRGLKI